MNPRIYGTQPGEPKPLRAVPDLAGLPVDDAEGEPVGHVYGSLVDEASGLVRYLDLTLDGTDRHLLVPIGHSRIRDEGPASHVHLRAAIRDELAEIPPHEPHPRAGDRDNGIDGDHQRRLLAAHGRLFNGERYYAHPAFDHSGLYAGEHPIRRGSDDGGDARGSRLRSLSDLPNVRFGPGQPDIRGWTILSAEGSVAGTVDDLLIDPAEEEIRYVVAGRGDDSRRLLLPVGFLRVQPKRNRVELPVLTRDDLRALPAAPDGPPGREWEDALRRVLNDLLDGARLFDRPDYRAPA